MNNFLISKNKLGNIAWLMVGAMFFISDRLLKNLALNIGPNQHFDLLNSWLQFRLVLNPYIAFSLPVSGQALNSLLTLIIVGLIISIFYLIFNKKEQKSLIIPLTFILFGAISNLLDRYLYGAVIDYFDLRYFTIFNLADSIISLGVIWAMIIAIKKN